MNEPIVSTMSRAEIELAIDWAAAEGWNPGLHDATPFAAADPDGFRIAKRDGEPVAVISAVRYGQTFGFIGLYIVSPRHRGHGDGWLTWQAGMRHLQGRTVGLDGVIAQQDNYRKSGFVLHHRNIRHEGRASRTNLPVSTSSVSLIPLTSVSFDALGRYDRAFFPAGRRAFLARWIDRSGTRGIALVREGTLSGYGVARPCRHGYKIGPLFAETEPAAELLYLALGNALPEHSTVFLDVPECNPAAMRLAERQCLQPMFETARMYRGMAPDVALDRTFGITTFELG